MFDATHLFFDYQDKSILGDIHFSLNEGELLFLRGKNGAGKTTLLKLLAGLLEPNAGQIFFNGKNIQDSDSDYTKSLCYIGHKATINPLLTVKENCFFDLHWGGRPIVLATLLKALNLEHLIDEPGYHLSAGQKRRLSLLRLFYTEAKLWLLDEPLTSLDEEGVTVLMKQIKHHLKEGGMVILTSHQPLPLDIEYKELAL
ncbi:MAG: cytochrome c biogenesis heme-transporting ATPase CcmA [Proteobacteria bacterium]|nr:cytochrome c biogenesis heme-transporting ATPase CcmA [Pseudomonadota bacterium]